MADTKQTGLNQMASPQVTVLMAVFNGEDWLMGCALAILTQTFRDFEFLIIDDGSTDRTLEILRGLATDDTRITVLRNPSNIGLTRCLNSGIAAARGKYIARMDADDSCDHRRLEMQVAAMEAASDVVLCGTDATVINMDGETIGAVYGPEDIDRAIRIRNHFIHGSLLVRTSSLRSIGGYNESFETAQDFDMILRLRPHGRFIWIAQSLYVLRRNTVGVSSRRANSQAYFTSLALFRDRFSRYPRQDLADSFKLAQILYGVYLKIYKLTIPQRYRAVVHALAKKERQKLGTEVFSTIELPKIDVIIPVYNCELSLRRCLRSVLAQRYSNLRVIAVNDGSKDGSLAVLNEHRGLIKDFVVVNQVNRGVGEARNAALRHISGEYVAFLDSDDSWREGKLHSQVAAMLAGKYIGSYCGRADVDEDGRLLRVDQRYCEGRITGAYLYNRVWPQTSTWLLSAQVIADNNIRFIGNWAEDFEFLSKFSLFGEFCSVRRPLINYTVGKTSLSASISNRFGELSTLRRLDKYLTEGKCSAAEKAAFRDALTCFRAPIALANTFFLCKRAGLASAYVEYLIHAGENPVDILSRVNLVSILRYATGREALKLLYCNAKIKSMITVVK